MSITPAVGLWWLTYDNGDVWPCEVIALALWDRVTVLPVTPAPDAGIQRAVPRRNVIDSAGNHPRSNTTQEV